MVDLILARRGEIGINVAAGDAVWTPMEQAVFHANAHLIERLLNDPRTDPNAGFHTPLIMAMMNNNPDLVSRLLDDERVRVDKSYLDRTKFTGSVWPRLREEHHQLDPEINALIRARLVRDGDATVQKTPEPRLIG